MTNRLTKGVASTPRRPLSAVGSWRPPFAPSEGGPLSEEGGPSSRNGGVAAAVAGMQARRVAPGRRGGRRVAPVLEAVDLGRSGGGREGAARKRDRLWDGGATAGLRAGLRMAPLRALAGGDPGRPDAGGAPSPATVRRRLRVRWGRLVAAGVALYLLAGFVLQQWALWQARQDLRALDQQLAALRARHRQLQEAVRRVDDPAYVDETARRRLGLVKPGETVVQLVAPEGSAEEETREAPTSAVR